VVSARARRGERGQAMLLALLVLLLASIAAGLVATDLVWREKALQEESSRAHLRALLDAALATSLARLASHLSCDVDEERWTAAVRATTAAQCDALGGHRFRIHVDATWGARRGAAEAIVVSGVETRVISWRRVPPG
jgi:hypothetical protein